MTMDSCPVPMMKRASWRLLDGEWELNGKTINIPFPPGTPMSGYPLAGEEELTYAVNFEHTVSADGDRTFLYFGAVDQTCEVSVNGTCVGKHEGGYLPFSFDITGQLVNGVNSLKVHAVDTLSHDYPWGKQTKEPSGMWYTPVSGIWQSVGLFTVPKEHITSVTFTPDYDRGKILWEVRTTSSGEIAMEIVPTGQKFRSYDRSGEISFGPEGFRSWSPDDPFIYDVILTFGEDTVFSYFAMRKISVENVLGVNRICLNNSPVFLHGVLDQGYFPEGTYVPSSLEVYTEDVRRIKALGFNTVRKHIKIESGAFYEACDREGLMVIQDMVNSGDYHFMKDSLLPTVGFVKRKDTVKETDRRMDFFIRHMKDTVMHLYDHPSIIAYTIFNEGWGQFNSSECYDIVKSLDPGRLIDTASGWFVPGKTDLDSVHIYFRNAVLRPASRPMLLSECGGFVFDMKHDRKGPAWGYGRCRSTKALTRKIEKMYRKMVIPAMEKGLCGSIITQFTDVENEINGLYTYDRSSVKADPEKIGKLSEELLDTFNKITGGNKDVL